MSDVAFLLWLVLWLQLLCRSFRGCPSIGLSRKTRLSKSVQNHLCVHNSIERSIPSVQHYDIENSSSLGSKHSLSSLPSMKEQVELARQLPPQLLRLFKRWPPPQIAGLATASNMPKVTITEGDIVKEVPLYKTKKNNPFMPWKNPETGNWHGAHYSLRRQADLYRLAIKHNVLPLMPRSGKHPEVKEQKRIEHGIRVKGTGIGQKVKGHKWERTLDARLEKRRKAMEEMPALIKKWKQLGHGRQWKQWPK